MASQLTADQMQGTQGRDDGNDVINDPRVLYIILCIFCICIVRTDDGKPIRDFAGVQKQPHRDVVERLGRRRGTESKTVRGTRRDHISIPG